jgi:hypothetical protein
MRLSFVPVEKCGSDALITIYRTGQIIVGIPCVWYSSREIYFPGDYWAF